MCKGAQYNNMLKLNSCKLPKIEKLAVSGDLNLGLLAGAASAVITELQLTTRQRTTSYLNTYTLYR